MTVAIALTGGEANGAWFSDHALEGTPDEIRIAVGGEAGPALLDLPEDELELGEREVIYRRVSVGHMCSRGRGGSCSNYAIYEPAEGISPEERARMRQKILDDISWPVGR